MKTFMKKTLLLLMASVMFISNIKADNSTYKDWYKEGDIIFQCSKSSQSTLLNWTTLHWSTHCGIIIEKNNDLYVLEAVGPVKLTSFLEWINKGKYVGFHYKVLRYTDENIKINYKKYLGQKYDWSFKFNNGKMYCSELVYLIYKEQFGVELCKPRPAKDYNLLFIKDEMKKRGITEDQLMVAPSDIYKSELLKKAF